MQGDKQQMNGEREGQILHYPSNVLPERQQYLKESTVEDFKKITKAQIQREFAILNSAKYNESVFEDYHKYYDLNRYDFIQPYKYNRVILPNIKDYYFNSSLVRSVVTAKIDYIFCQAPLPNFQTFWQLIYWKRISTIVMLCDTKHSYEAQRYWPSLSQFFKYEKLNVKNIEEVSYNESLKKTSFCLEGQHYSHLAAHYHCKKWEDFTVPKQETFQNLQRLLDIAIKELEAGKQVLIHCSGGRGRTGTFTSILQAKRSISANNKVSIFKIVQNLRNHRVYCVQSAKQYAFIYLMIRKWLS